MTRSNSIPRFAQLSTLSDEYEQLYQWEIGMLHYYIRKVQLTMTREDVISLFEYIMSIPAYMASNPNMRRIVHIKLNDFHQFHSKDKVWVHTYRSTLGFLADLYMHPYYRA